MTHEVPEGWRTKKLSDALKLNRKSVSVAQLKGESKVLLHSIPAFDEWRKPELCDGESIKSNKTVVPEDCVLFSKLNPRIPRIWRVQHDGKTPSVCSTEFWPLTAKTTSIDLDFTTYFLSSPIFLENPHIKPASSTNSHQRVDRKAFENFTLCLPPLPEQKKIAEVLTSMDEAIAATKAVIDQTKQVKKGLLQTLLTKGIGHTKFKQTELGEIPESWEVMSIGTLIEKGILLGIQDGNHGGDHPKTSDFVETGIPFVMARDIIDGNVDTEHCAKISLEQANRLRVGFSYPGDILLTHKGTVGRVGETPKVNSFIMLTPQVTYYRLPEDGTLMKSFLKSVLIGPSFQRSLRNNSDQTTRKYISLTDQKRLHIPIPPLNEQAEIAKSIDEVAAALSRNSQLLIHLELTKSGLLHDLLTGRKRVEV